MALLSDGQPAEPFAVLEDIGIDFLKNGLRIHGFRRVLGEDGFAEAAVPGREATEESGEQAAQTDDTEHGKPLGEQWCRFGAATFALRNDAVNRLPVAPARNAPKHRMK